MFQNKHWIEGDVAYLSLNHDKVTMIDVADLEEVLKSRWGALRTKDGFWYVYTSGPTYLHRFLTGAPKGKVVDHRNHDTLDNRRSNLRIVEHQENDSHRDGAYSTSQTGIRGVSRWQPKPTHKPRYVFRCHIKQCKVCKYFPCTDEGLEAARQFAEEHYEAMRVRIEANAQ